MSHLENPMADRISSLPDAVLCHILSFLPTKLAVATSVLSKRWKPLWLSVPTLDFNDEYVGENGRAYFRFVRFVYKVMLSRDLNQPITRFRLKCESCLCDPPDVNTWVNAAIQRKVQHLNLTLPEGNINLPSSILTSETLVVLKLKSLTVNAVPSVCFHSLKILHLKSVTFLEHRYLKVLLSKCPNLEDLRLCNLQFYDEVNWGGIGTEQGFKTLHKLVRADISYLSSGHIPLKSICNVQFLRMEMDHAEFNNIPVFHKLTHLEVIFASCYCWDFLEKLLKHCPKLQILVIDKLRYPNSSYDNDWVEPQFVPECVSSHLKTCSLGDYEGLQGELQFARYVMKNARVLQTMSIYCTAKLKLRVKFQMLKELSLCPRSSVSCELSFE